jgi:hypothetical protein
MLELPHRRGPRPVTSDGIPHQQQSDTPEPELYRLMKARFLALRGTETGPSLISVPGATALFLPEHARCDPEAFFRGREFAHIHPPYDGSFHMILTERDCDAVLARGWGELHPFAESGRIQPTVTMIYAPRDEAEVATVMDIAAAAFRRASDGASSLEA